MKRLLALLFALAMLPTAAMAAPVTIQDVSNPNLGMTVNSDGSIKVAAGGYEFNVQDTPTVQNAAYSASNCIGGFRTLTVSRTASGGIILDNFSVRTITGITPTIQVYLFTANPSASTCTDKSTFTINSADVDKIPAGGVFQVTLAQPQGSTPSFGAVTNLALSMNANSSSQIYYALVATASTTPGSVSDIHVSANGLQD
jgi:hypothetical protein